MQLSRPLWLVLAVAGALILLASNAINSSDSTTTSSQEARPKYSKDQDVRAGDPLKTPLPTSSLLAFVGVMTAARHERRQAVRSTWFPSSEADLASFERDTNVKLRFVVGHLQEQADQAILDEEQRLYDDFLVLDVRETYENMILKAYLYFRHVQSIYNPAFIIKTDDDVYIRPDRIAQAIPQWQAKGGEYIGAMLVGNEALDMTDSPWYEPLGVLHNKQYYMYASGGFYALSAAAVQLLFSVPLSQRRLSGGSDDTTVGLWVLGYNIPYLDDSRLGVGMTNDTCPDNFIMLTGDCNGLCNPEETILKLHQDPSCTKADMAELPMLLSGYDFGPVGCIKLDESGNIDKTSCFQ